MAKTFLDSTADWSAPEVAEVIKQAALAAHPVGSYYWSSDKTSPATLFGGKWEEVSNRFLYAVPTTSTAGSTGGAATVTLATTQIPSHTHTGPSHTHSVNEHSHSLPSHTHSSASHSHGLNSHTHTMLHYHDMQHCHDQTGMRTSNRETTDTYGLYMGSTAFAGRVVISNDSSMSSPSYFGTTNTRVLTGLPLSPVSGSTSSYFYTGRPLKTQASGSSNYKDSTDAASGSTASTTPGATGAWSGTSSAVTGSTAASGTQNTGATGGGTAHENMPPYISAYCWHRTA